MMHRLVILFLLGGFTFLFGNENIFTDAKIVIQLVEKKDIQFISAEESSNVIRGSKSVNLNLLSSTTILGNMPCAPLYGCPNKIKKYLSNLGIVQNQSLILYDHSYGVYAATLYTILESIGHRNITILNGGIDSITKLDPNQILYTKYRKELDALQKESNSSKKQDESEVKSLVKKLEMLAPHLLTEKNSFDNVKQKSDYVLGTQNKSYLLSKKSLKKAVYDARKGASKLNMIDVCPMIDIVGNQYGNYLSGVTAFSWKRVIDKKSNRIKDKKVLEDIFEAAKISKGETNYLYCMSESSKALYIMMVMRELGYTKVKAFTGNWNVWREE